MYIKQVIDNKESWWGYIVTVVLIVPLAVFLFSIPHGLILASKGYPQNYPKDTHIKNLNEFENSEDFYIFHAATKIQNNQILANGGRVLSIVSLKETYAECRDEIFEVAEKIDWEFKYYRKDIGANY